MGLMKTFISALILSAVVLANAQTPPSAKSVVEDAQNKAAKSKKAVFVSFHASWCGWCHRMEDVLNEKPVKAVMDKYFVPASLVVLESKDKKDLENKGSDEYLEKSGGKDQGIPYFYFTDAKGKLIINSKDEKGNNVGCPYAPAELAHFLKMLKSAAPKISTQELGVVEKAFQAAAKKAGH